MKLSIKLCILNLRRYPKQSLGIFICLIFLSCSLLSISLYAVSINTVMSELSDSHNSGNTIVIETAVSDLDSIRSMQYIKEAVVYFPNNFVSGAIRIEDIGIFDINTMLHSGSIPSTYTEEFHAITDDELIVRGRLPELANELIINEEYLQELQITNYDEIIGKSIDIYHEYLGDVCYDLQSVTIVGVYSQKFLEINALSQRSDMAHCFYIESQAVPKGIIAYCNLSSIDMAYQQLCDKYGSDRLIMSTITPVALVELSNLSRFIRNLLCLAVIIVIVVYGIIQITIVTNYLNDKKLFMIALNSYGYSKSRLCFALLMEYTILLVGAFIISTILAIGFLELVYGIITPITGIVIAPSINYGIIILCFIMLVVTNYINILIAAFAARAKDNN